MRNTYNTEKTYEEDARCAIMVSRNTKSAITQMIKKIRLSISETFTRTRQGISRARREGNGGIQLIPFSLLYFKINSSSGNTFVNSL